MAGWKDGKPSENSLGRAPLGGSKMEATTGWTEGKPWEIAWGESSVGKERDGSDGRVDGGETVGNSLGRAPLGRSAQSLMNPMASVGFPLPGIGNFSSGGDPNLQQQV